MEETAFFLKDKSCLGQKLTLKSILLFYKDLLEIKSCLLIAIFKVKLATVFGKIFFKVYNNDCYKFFKLRTLSVG